MPDTGDVSIDRLRVSEIFYSLQGESSRVGLPTIFVRLTGCPLRCSWCDSAHAFAGGAFWTIRALLERLAEYPCRRICVTGGEPLAQKACRLLLVSLCDAGYEVSLETSGAVDICGLDPRVSVVLDIKLPGSGESDRNLWDNLPRLRSQDEIKLVVSDRQDYEWGVALLRSTPLLPEKGPPCVPILMSPVQGILDPALLAQWILEDGLEVRFQLQLHKILWGSELGR